MSNPPTELNALNLRGRLALNQREAAQALGLSENSLRVLTPQIPHVRAGNRLLYPVDGLRAWLEEQSQQQLRREEATAESLLAAFSDE